ncbi:succinate-semialdehyde dehydrogenase / glutarate-semialdehyde dehydrogenase, partial [Geosmithia morbida]
PNCTAAACERRRTSGRHTTLVGFLQADVPDGVMNIATALDKTPEIGQISFTGSTRVGRILIKRSSDAVEKLSLELGGNAPFIVFDDADVDLAVQSVVASKFKVTGQTCICWNRVYVQKPLHDEFVAKLVAAVNAFRVGNAVDSSITHGRNRLDDIFVPLEAVQSFETEEEVVDSANQCDVGLASYVFSEQARRIALVVEKLHSGMVAVNTDVVSDSAAPFGGTKQSVLGRGGSQVRHG